MKKCYSLLQFTFALVLLTGLSVNAQNSLVVTDPTEWLFNSQHPALIEEASVLMEPQGLYAKVELEMYLSAAPIASDWQADDTLELVLHFDLPQEAIIFDSYLWIDGEQVQAGIYERNFGVEVYESIVQRRQDPSLLLKMNQGKYQLRVFPLPALENRRVRIDFLMPAHWHEGVAQASIPTAILQASAEVVPIELSIQENDAFPLLDFSNSALEFTTESDLRTLITNSDELSAAEYISWELPTENGLWLEVDDLNNEYQYLFDARSQIPGLESGRDIVLVMHTAAAEISEDEVKKILQRSFSLYLNDQDRLAIMIDNTVLNPDQPWFSGIDNIINAINNEHFSTTEELPDKLRAANIFLAEQAEQTGLVIAVSSVPLSSTQNADIENWLGDLPQPYQSIVWDIYDWGQSASYHFSRNTSAYNPLLQLTGGFISSNGSVEDRLFRAFENRSIKSGFIQLEIEPTEGLTYANYGNLTASGGEGIYLQYRQFGQFVGSPSWQLDYSTFINNQLSTNTTSAEYSSHITDQLHRIYVGNKLKSKEQSNASQVSIVNESISERILTTKTVFLALDPALVAEDECVGCEIVDEFIVVNTKNISTANWKAQIMGNPGKDRLQVRWIHAPEAEEVFIQLFNLSGQILHQQYIRNSFNDGEIFLEWNELQDLPAGTYLIRLSQSTDVQFLRFIKS